MPRPGRKIWLPTLLTEERLPEVLSLGHHLHVLNVVCAQCPPDSRDYIRVKNVQTFLMNEYIKIIQLCINCFDSIVYNIGVHNN